MVFFGLLIANAALMVLLVTNAGKNRDWKAEDKEQMDWLQQHYHR